MRRGNRKPPSRGALMTVVTLLPSELRELRFNTPGPSGLLGGYQRHENWIIENVDIETMKLTLDPERLIRTMNYTRTRPDRTHGPGGPNARLRRALIPALRRIGIDVNAG